MLAGFQVRKSGVYELIIKIGNNLMFFPTIYWWSIISLLGVLVFPLASLLFVRFWDRGWALSKILGIGMLSFCIFIAGSFKILAFEDFNLWLLVLLFAFANYKIFQSRKKDIKVYIRKHWRLLVFEEGLFFLGLVFWSWVRAHNPDINGLEKFMDFGFLNSILRSRFFPPKDMWFSGFAINYYYFGHLVAAVLTKLSGLPASITYNLMISTIFAFALSASFSIAASFLINSLKGSENRQNLILAGLAGMISALVLSFAGNLHSILTVLTKGAEGYWYPDATRYIPYTIHEFPQYSFVVSDLHGHVNNIPFVLLAVALIYSLFLRLSFVKTVIDAKEIHLRILGLGAVLGVIYMTNALDAPIYFFLFALSVFFLYGKRTFKRQNIINIFLLFLFVLLFSAITSLPFQINFKPFTQGLGWVRVRSEIPKLLVLWGFFLAVGLSYIWFYILEARILKKKQALFKPNAHRFYLAVILTSLVLVAVPEFIFFKDIYISEFHRANTMFKLVYQTFILMSLVTGPVFLALFMMIRRAKSWTRYGLSAVLFILILGFFSVVSYSWFAIRSYYHDLKTYQGLDGTAWMKSAYPGDFGLIAFINKNIKDQPVIAEAVGESYTDYGRISANSGLPTVLGWRVHEWLWRGSFDEPGLRTADMERLYEAGNSFEACRIVNKYGIDYIVIGDLERQKYPGLSESTIGQISNPIFSQDNTSLYQIQTPCRAR